MDKLNYGQSLLSRMAMATTWSGWLYGCHAGEFTRVNSIDKIAIDNTRSVTSICYRNKLCSLCVLLVLPTAINFCLAAACLSLIIIIVWKTTLNARVTWTITRRFPASLILSFAFCFPTFPAKEEVFMPLTRMRAVHFHNPSNNIIPSLVWILTGPPRVPEEFLN